jgi:excinuclease ABC subunit C
MENIILVLEGGIEELTEKLTLKMQIFSKEQNFEAASQVRDQINALSRLGQARAQNHTQNELEGAKALLKLKKLPLRIEAFDISNIFGKEATGSMVSFYRGFADKDNYRRFRIKTVEAIDDYAMLREVIKRRYARVIEEKLPLPDLVLIDGGRAHLLVAQKEIERLGLDIPLVSIAKEKENLYIKNSIRPINLGTATPALNLIRRIRDEAHRFAISYHHVLHRKKIIGE